MNVEWKKPPIHYIHVYGDKGVLRQVKEKMSQLDGKEVVEVCVLVQEGGDEVVKLVERQLVLHRKPNVLISIALEGRRLEKVPAVFHELVSLNGLDLGSNMLKNLPAQLTKLTELKLLYLHENQFEEFPMVLCELLNLEVLVLHSNKLKALLHSSHS